MPERMALVAGRTLYGLPGPHEEVRAARHNPNAGRLARRPRGRWRRRGRRRDGLTVRACAAVGGPNDQKGETRPERSSHRRDLTMRLAGRQAVLGKRETAWGRRLRCAFPQGDTRREDLLRSWIATDEKTLWRLALDTIAEDDDADFDLVGPILLRRPQGLLSDGDCSREVLSALRGAGARGSPELHGRSEAESEHRGSHPRLSQAPLPSPQPPLLARAGSRPAMSVRIAHLKPFLPRPRQPARRRLPFSLV